MAVMHLHGCQLPLNTTEAEEEAAEEEEAEEEVWRLPFLKELECNRPAGELSVRMLVALAGLVYMCFVRVLSSRYIAECLLHAFVSVRWSKYVAVHVLQRAVVANRQPSACRWRKQTMSANKTKKVKMATKSCPECDQQVRKYIIFIFECCNW